MSSEADVSVNSSGRDRVHSMRKARRCKSSHFSRVEEGPIDLHRQSEKLVALVREATGMYPAQQKHLSHIAEEAEEALPQMA